MIVALPFELDAQQVRRALFLGGQAKIFLGSGFSDARGRLRPSQSRLRTRKTLATPGNYCRHSLSPQTCTMPQACPVFRLKTKVSGHPTASLARRNVCPSSGKATGWGARCAWAATPSSARGARPSLRVAPWTKHSDRREPTLPWFHVDQIIGRCLMNGGRNEQDRVDGKSAVHRPLRAPKENRPRIAAWFHRRGARAGAAQPLSLASPGPYPAPIR